MSCFFKKLDDGQSVVHDAPPAPNKKLSVNFRHALFPLSDFLTFEEQADGLSPNIGKELSMYTV
jgi:hypothetical protein